MNRKQKIVLLIAVVIIALAVIFPPVGPGKITTYDINSPLDNMVIMIIEHDQPLGFIFEDYDNVRFDLLLMGCIFVGIVAGLLIYAFKEKQVKSYSKS